MILYLIYLSIHKLCFSSSEMILGLKILLIICTLIHDMVQATVITSYCLQAQLLQAHLMFLRERLLNRTITPLNWMRVR